MVDKRILYMDIRYFYEIYIPALELALEEDHINNGFHVKGPEDFLDKNTAFNIDLFLEKNEDKFTEKVAYYFDAKSHNFPSIEGIDIDEYRLNILRQIREIKDKFKL